MKHFLIGLALCALAGIVPLFAQGRKTCNAVSKRDAALVTEIRGNATMQQVHAMAFKLLKGGFDAGSHYPSVWIRDMNTFVDVALEVNSRASVRSALLPFFEFQGADGDIVDGYRPLVAARVRPTTRLSPLAPKLTRFKNTVEIDQESSLVQAVYKYVTDTGDRTFLDERIGGKSVRERLAIALDCVLTDHYDPSHGLIWGATRADWGDVQPETNPGVRLDSHSHRALSIYDNAMFLMAVDDYVKLLGPGSPEADHWEKVGARIKRNIRKYLWDKKSRSLFRTCILTGRLSPRASMRMRFITSVGQQLQWRPEC